MRVMSNRLLIWVSWEIEDDLFWLSMRLSQAGDCINRWRTSRV